MPSARVADAGGRTELRLFVAQRISAMVLAPLVLVHLVTIIVAVRQGLSAEQILARTEGNLWWTGFYGLFVAAAAVHAPIGLRTIAREMLGWHGRSLDLAAVLFGVFLLLIGFRAVGAVT